MIWLIFFQGGVLFKIFNTVSQFILLILFKTNLNYKEYFYTDTQRDAPNTKMLKLSFIVLVEYRGTSINKDCAVEILLSSNDDLDK